MNKYIQDADLEASHDEDPTIEETVYQFEWSTVETSSTWLKTW